MRPHLVFLISWLAAGFGAVAGSVLGNAAGSTGLIAGGLVGGLIGVWLGELGAARLKWLPPELRRGATWGGAIGFLVAAPIALTSLDTPITPVLSCGLAGAGALIGAGVARTRRPGT